MSSHDDVLSSLSAGRTPEGLPTSSRGGPDVSVRPALASDADALGAIHAATMTAALAAGLGADGLDAGELGIDAGQLALAWARAADERAPGHHVLTALDGAEVVGLAALAPSGGEADAQRPTLEILALEVAAGHERVGHGSRLLAACADLATTDGAGALEVWVVRGDEARARFLDSSGFAPSPDRRALTVGGGEVTQVRWWALLD